MPTNGISLKKMPKKFTFDDICHKITFSIWRPLTFQDPWHFVTFNTSWHLTLHDIFHFMTFFISLNNPLFKYIPHFGSFWHFVIYFQEYATCWVFLALHHMLYLCILYLYLSLSLYSSSPYDRRHRPLSINIWVFPRIHLADPPPFPLKMWQNLLGPVRAHRHKTNRYPRQR